MWSPAVRDVIKYIEDPAAKSDYFEPLRQFLYTLPDQRRIEIPFTRSHWEGAEIAPDVPLARGWLRQLDTGLNPIFYKGKINRLTYASWLAENAVRYVALPSAKPDKSSYGERALIEKGLPYLRLRWKSDDWRRLRGAAARADRDPAGRRAHRARAVRLGRAAARRQEARRGDREGALDAVLVRVNGACVEPDGDWTRVITDKVGFVRLSTRFSPERLFSARQALRRLTSGATFPAPGQVGQKVVPALAVVA